MTVYFPPKSGPHVERAGREAPAAVLLVEDEPALLKLATRLLVRAGFIVVAHPGPDEALSWWADGANSETIHIVVTDVAMPRMPGPEMLRQMRASQPEVAALLVSGNPNYRTLSGDITDPLLMKPYTAAEFIDVVKTILASPPRGRA